MSIKGITPDEMKARILEELRDAVINAAITVRDEDGHFLDCVQTEDLVSFYEKHAPDFTFYKYPDTCPCRRRYCAGDLCDEWPCPDCGTLEGPAAHSANTCPKREKARNG